MPKISISKIYRLHLWLLFLIFTGCIGACCLIVADTQAAATPTVWEAKARVNRHQQLIINVDASQDEGVLRVIPSFDTFECTADAADPRKFRCTVSLLAVDDQHYPPTATPGTRSLP